MDTNTDVDTPTKGFFVKSVTIYAGGIPPNLSNVHMVVLVGGEREHMLLHSRARRKKLSILQPKVFNPSSSVEVEELRDTYLRRLDHHFPEIVQITRGPVVAESLRKGGLNVAIALPPAVKQPQIKAYADAFDRIFSPDQLIGSSRDT